MNMDVLDNPAWHSLRGHHAALGRSADAAATYDSQVSVFGAVAESSGLPDLAGLLAAGEVVGIACPEPIANPDPAQWKQHQVVPVHQMVCEAPVPGPDADMVRLGPEHVDAMLALVKLTEPGPFAPRTIEMGHYWGVIEDGRLLAMAGERLCPPGWVELSGVCTPWPWTGGVSVYPRAAGSFRARCKVLSACCCWWAVRNYCGRCLRATWLPASTPNERSDSGAVVICCRTTQHRREAG